MKKLITLALLAASVHLSAETLLTTNNFKITLDDFTHYVDERIPTHQQNSVLSQPGAVKDLLENLYVINALAFEGAQLKDLDEDKIAWQVEHYKNRLLMSAYINSKVQERLLTFDFEKAAKEEYLADRERFRSQEKVNAAHILISTETKSEAEALQLAEALYLRIAKGESFAEIAKEYSDDPTAKTNSGELGDFTRGMMVGPFEEAAFNLKEPGSISKPILTNFGYHIIKLNDHAPSRQLSFEEVKDRIIEGLKESMHRRVNAEIVTAYRTGEVDLGLEVNQDAFNALELKYLK